MSTVLDHANRVMALGRADARCVTPKGGSDNQCDTRWRKTGRYGIGDAARLWGIS